MKLKKKNKGVAPNEKNSNIDEELSICRKQLKDEIKELHNQEDKVFALKRHIFDLENAPFTDGDKVIMTLQMGRVQKEYTCVLNVELNALDEYVFKATPIKEDGSLSGRSFKVYDKSHIRYAHEK